VLGPALKRLLTLVATLWLAATLTFLLLRLLPGGPFDRARVVPAEVQRALDARYHLDEPMLRQYGRWLGDLVLRGDLGPTFRYPNRTVNEIVALGLPVSLTLGALALAFALALGVPLGVWSATRPGTAGDAAATGISLVGLSLPQLVTAPLLVLVFALQLHLLPVARWETWRHMVLPVICSGLPTAACIARLTRAGMLDVLGAEHLRAARARGMPERTVILVHAMRAGLLPVVSFLGPAASGLLVGSLVVEKIFAIPGLGRYFVEAATNRDYNVVASVVLVYGALVLALNAAADLACAALDPRIALR
jgi:oligopeptide transport system permease protein